MKKSNLIIAVIIVVLGAFYIKNKERKSPKQQKVEVVTLDESVDELSEDVEDNDAELKKACLESGKFWSVGAESCMDKKSDQIFVKYWEKDGIVDNKARKIVEQYKKFGRVNCRKITSSKIQKLKDECDKSTTRSWNCEYHKCMSHMEAFPFFKTLRSIPPEWVEANKETFIKKKQYIMDNWCLRYYGNTGCQVSADLKKSGAAVCPKENFSYLPKFKKCADLKAFTSLSEMFVGCIIPNKDEEVIKECLVQKDTVAQKWLNANY